MSARETALNVLIACRKEAAWSNGILKEYIERDGLDSRDAALASRLCYGVLQNRELLDFYLKQLLTGKIKALHPIVRDVLHLGLYQIYKLDKVPDSAAVNESVVLVKKYCRNQQHASGLVNAVLRSAVRTKGSLKEPTSYVEKFSHPQKLVDMLKEYVGKERLAGMLVANNEIPPTVIQVNTLRITPAELSQQLAQEGIYVQSHAWMPDCLVLTNTGNLERLRAFKDGLFYVQDAAARLSVLCAELPEQGRVLDCCSAPGGKSFAAAIAMKGKGTITSCDIHAYKTILIQKGADRLGLDCISVMQQDAAQCREEWIGTMDAVLADVPCSGYGIIRKKPDIRYKKPEDMEQLPQLQLQILCNQAEYVKPGGVLLYSTCTLLYRENEGVVKAFLEQRPDYYPEPLKLPDIFPENTSGMLALIPGEYDTDGFFICRLRRKA